MEVEITSSIDEDGALYVDMKGDHMGILIGKRGTDSGRAPVSGKPCGKQAPGRLCKGEAGYRELPREKRRDSETSCKEYCSQGKEKQKTCCT